MIFVNKLDRERASFERTLEQLRTEFGAGIAPLELPIGEEAAFRGVADLLTDKAFIYEGGTHTEGEIPDELTALEHEVHDNLVEGIVVADDDVLERFLEGDIPSLEELEHTLAVGVADGVGVPGRVRLGRRPRSRIDRLADFICEIGPSPADRPGVEVDRRRLRASRWPPMPTASRSRSCSRRSPTPTSASSRCSRCCRAP